MKDPFLEDEKRPYQLMLYYQLQRRENVDKNQTVDKNYQQRLSEFESFVRIRQFWDRQNRQ